MVREAVPMCAYDPDTLSIMRRVFDETWEMLRKDQNGKLSKLEVAGRILRTAGTGETDPNRLRNAALADARSGRPPPDAAK